MRNERLPFDPRWLDACGSRLKLDSGIVYDGFGMLKVRPGAIQRGIDGNLYRVLRCAADELGIGLLVYAADNRKGNSQSRAVGGLEVLISDICRPGLPWEKATPKHLLAVKLMAWLRKQGFREAERCGQCLSHPAAYWGKPYLHVSIVKRKSPPG